MLFIWDAFVPKRYGKLFFYMGVASCLFAVRFRLHRVIFICTLHAVFGTLEMPGFSGGFFDIEFGYKTKKGALLLH